MKRTLLIFFGVMVCVFFAFQNVKRNDEISTLNLKGNWYLHQWTAYHTLKFSDSSIFVDNSGDTIFNLNYTLLNDTLTTWLPESNQKYKNKIIKLSKDSLVINGIHEAREIRTYTRTK